MALPDRPDPAQLRRRARELQRAARAGEPDAVARVQAQGFDPGTIGLRRAQHALARELGHASWPELVAVADGAELGAPRRRSAGSHSAQALSRAMGVAGKRRDPGLLPAHVVLALLQASSPAGAAAPVSASGAPLDAAPGALAALGVTVASVTERLGPGGDPDATVSVGSTPTWHALMGWAAGLALGRGSERVEPPDVLGSLAYGLPPGDLAAEVGVDPDELHAALAQLGHPVPPVRPSAIWVPSTP